MADRYIDVLEVTEYGDFFLTESRRLVGASALVNVEALRAAVQSAKEKVEEERTRAGIAQKSNDPQSVTEAAEALRGHLNRFYSFLNSLDPREDGVEVGKFFPGNVLDGLHQLKPADLKTRAQKVSEGFSLDAYKALALLEPWKKKLSQAEANLTDALSGKDSKKTEGSLLTASLSSAREEFLTAYNTVAKPLLRGLLNSLGRGEEFELYFKDLQVNESKSTKPAEATKKKTEARDAD